MSRPPLCIAANWLGPEGWPLYTGSTVGWPLYIGSPEQAREEGREVPPLYLPSLTDSETSLVNLCVMTQGNLCIKGISKHS